MKRALVTGVTGQDGAYLSKLLLEKADIAVSPGLGFGEYGEGFVRLSLTTPDDLVNEGIKRISRWETGIKQVTS